MIDARWQVAAYLLSSIVLRLVATRLVSQASGSPRWAFSLTSDWRAWALRFVYYVGLPYITLVLGVLPARYLGLTGLDHLQAVGYIPSAGNLFAQARAALSLLLLAWLPDLGRLAELSVLLCLVVAFTWLIYRHTRRILPVCGTVASPTSPATFSRSAYAAIHWSFYRASVWLLAGDLYLGVVGGAALVGVEWMLCNRWAARPALQTTPVELQMADASVLAATSTLFYYVPNLWLLIPVHWLLALVSWRILRPVCTSARSSSARRQPQEAGAPWA